MEQVKGLCECGCGRIAPVSPYTLRSKGYVKGEPRRFIRGHNRPPQEIVPAEIRFFSKVDRGLPGECWPWRGGHSQGYGRFYFEGRLVPATHWSYEHFNGLIPPGQDVLHHCDNSPCVNPAHLFLGDQKANGHDMVAKGRSARGPKHGMAKLTEDDVMEMRERSTGTKGDATLLAAEYGVTVANVCYILKRHTWKHL